MNAVCAVVLECEFRAYPTVYGSQYSCSGNNFRTSLNNRTVTEVKGQHLANETNDDVKLLIMNKQHSPYLPLKVGDFFKNLEILYIMNSNVQHLMQGDLKGLDKLKIFDVSYNPIEQLGPDFFKGHGSIETVSFYDCHLKIIDPFVLDPLDKLEVAYFDMNVCIDLDKSTPIESLKAEFKDKCQNHIHDNQIMMNHSAEQVKCPLAMSNENSLPFIKQHSYAIIGLLSVSLVILSLIIFRAANSNVNKHWNELTLMSDK